MADVHPLPRDGSRPYVLINVAMTADGKTDTVERRGAAISSAEDMARVDALRADCDAIMVGGHTLLGDDPRLTVKSAALRAERVTRGLPESPMKVAIVSEALPSPESRYLTTGPARRVIFTTERADTAGMDAIRAVGGEVLVAGLARVDLAAVMAWLAREGVRRLLVEGGGTLNAALLALGLVDEVRIYVAPLVFGGASAPTLVEGPGLSRAEAIALQLAACEAHVDDGVTLRYRVVGRV